MYKTEGIILRNTGVKDKDVILTILTKDFGKKNIYVRSYLDPKTKYFGRLEVPSHIEFMFIKRKNSTYLLTGLEQIRGFCDMFYNPYLYTLFSIGSEVTLKMLPYEERNELIYKWFKWFLYFLNSKKMEEYLAVYLIRFLYLSGFFPIKNRCGKCGKKNPLYFTVSGLEIFCIDCVKDGKRFYPSYVLEYIKRMFEKDFLKKIQFKGIKEVIDFLILFIEEIVEEKILSYRVLATVGK
ncbi:MAG: DNA repair protein RecO [Caldiserica bacterium]|nr:MAG: DNA repair protein RecO [Caldisericota bacterium]